MSESKGTDVDLTTLEGIMEDTSNKLCDVFTEAERQDLFLHAARATQTERLDILPYAALVDRVSSA